MSKKRAAFFDRDGTLIENIPYLADASKIKLIEKVVPLCLFLQKQGFMLFVVSNQSGIARGFFDENCLKLVNDCARLLLEQRGIVFESFYYCPHHPAEGAMKKYSIDCSCRKPKPGMLLRAAKEHDIDLKSSLMFGDSRCDLDAGRAAGCRSFLVEELLGEGERSFNNLI